MLINNLEDALLLIADLDAALFFFSGKEVTKRLLNKTPQNDLQIKFASIEKEAINRHQIRLS